MALIFFFFHYHLFLLLLRGGRGGGRILVIIPKAQALSAHRGRGCLKTLQCRKYVKENLKNLFLFFVV